MLEVGRLTVYSRIKVSSMIAGTQVTSNIPIAWFLVLGCNRQARVSYEDPGGYYPTRDHEEDEDNFGPDCFPFSSCRAKCLPLPWSPADRWT